MTVIDRWKGYISAVTERLMFRQFCPHSEPAPYSFTSSTQQCSRDLPIRITSVRGCEALPPEHLPRTRFPQGRVERELVPLIRQGPLQIHILQHHRIGIWKGYSERPARRPGHRH
jgi:hypothetical protein